MFLSAEKPLYREMHRMVEELFEVHTAFGRLSMQYPNTGEGWKTYRNDFSGKLPEIIYLTAGSVSDSIPHGIYQIADSQNAAETTIRCID